jgi:cell division protein FtsW (lipid II flippase)
LILTGKIANLKQFIPIAIGLALVISLGFSFFNPDFVQQRIDSFVSRWNQAPPYLFIQDQFIFAISYGGFIGRGVGSATSSARVFGYVSFLETYHPKVWFEIGVLGFIIYMVFLTTLLYYTFKAYRSLKDPALRSFAASFWVFMLVISYLPYWYPLDTDPVAVYYWLFAGVILRLPVLEKQEKDNLVENVDNSATTQIKFKRKKFSLA